MSNGLGAAQGSAQPEASEGQGPKKEGCTMFREAIRSATPNNPRKEVAPESAWDHRFRVGDVVRTVGGGGAYNRGEIVEVAEAERYYRVDYGLGFPSLIREENLEAFDEKDPLIDLPRSFRPPVLPSFM